MTVNNIAPQGLFGPGIMWLTPTSVANGTPVNVGFINEFSYDMKAELKELTGQNTYSLLAARGTTKVSGKIKPAALSGQVLNGIFLNGTWTVGTQYDVYTTPATTIPATPFKITPTMPNTGTWQYDLGVINAVTAEPMTLVAASPSAGQYSVSGGIYTFSSADEASGVTVVISSAYSYESAPGQSLIMPNFPIGESPSFQIDYKTTLYGATYMVTFFNAIASGWTMGHKISDFTSPEYDVAMFVNAAQQLGRISVATQA